MTEDNAEDVLNADSPADHDLLDNPAVYTHEGTADSVAEKTDLATAPSEDRLPTVPQLCIAIFLLVVVLGYPTAMQFIGESRTIATATPQQHLAEQEEKGSDAHQAADPFGDITISAKAAYVWDVAKQRPLYTKNAQAQLPLASLTKLMTALVASELYDTDTPIPITLDAIRQDGENGFEDGDEWEVKDLLDFTLMTSSNDGAYALAAAAGTSGGDSGEESFVKKMNEKAEEIGLTQTYFINATGLDASEMQSGSYGSARDVAMLVEYILEHAPHLLQRTTQATASFTNLRGTAYSATNTNEAIENLDYPLASKTGYTVLAGGNLVIAFNVGLNHPVIVSVLGSTREGRFTDVDTLRERIISYVSTLP